MNTLIIDMFVQSSATSITRFNADRHTINDHSIDTILVKKRIVGLENKR